MAGFMETRVNYAIEDLDTTGAWEWDVLTTFRGVVWWWQPGKPEPTPEQASEAKAHPDFASVRLDELDATGVDAVRSCYSGRTSPAFTSVNWFLTWLSGTSVSFSARFGSAVAV